MGYKINKPVLFGPNGAKHFKKYDDWKSSVNGLLILAVSNGLIAQDGPNGVCKAFWSYNLNKGWSVWKK